MEVLREVIRCQLNEGVKESRFWATFKSYESICSYEIIIFWILELFFRPDAELTRNVIYRKDIICKEHQPTWSIHLSTHRLNILNRSRRRDKRKFSKLITVTSQRIVLWISKILVNLLRISFSTFLFDFCTILQNANVKDFQRICWFSLWWIFFWVLTDFLCLCTTRNTLTNIIKIFKTLA